MGEASSLGRRSFSEAFLTFSMAGHNFQCIFVILEGWRPMLFLNNLSGFPVAGGQFPMNLGDSQLPVPSVSSVISLDSQWPEGNFQ